MQPASFFSKVSKQPDFTPRWDSLAPDEPLDPPL